MSEENTQENGHITQTANSVGVAEQRYGEVPLEQELAHQGEHAAVNAETVNEESQVEHLNEIVVEDEDDPFKNVQIGLDGKYKKLLIDFWQDIIDDMQSLNDNLMILQNEQFMSKFSNISSAEEEGDDYEMVPENEFYAEMDANDRGEGFVNPSSHDPLSQSMNGVTNSAESIHNDAYRISDIPENEIQATQNGIHQVGSDTTTVNNMNEEASYSDATKQQAAAKSASNYLIHSQLAKILKEEEESLKQLVSIIYHSKEDEQGESEGGDPYRQNKLPLARIKKLMKFDHNLKMISSETPILFSKLCEVFIQELTLRAWSIVDSDKRRTVQKQDILNALVKSDVYDFLIDIVPRT